MPPNIIHLHNKADLDKTVADSESKPTVIYVSNSSTPTCKAFTPKYEGIASKYANDGVTFAIMEFGSATSMLFKFAPNQLPVIVLMYGGKWCKTVMGADAKELENGLGGLVKVAAA